MRTVAVSIIMPVYNSALYLSDALKSLAQQTVKCFELIAVDDCSTDYSPDLILAFSAKHPEIPVQLIRNPVNLGDCSSRNVGLQQARGAYISMLDSDDVYREDFVELLLKHIETTKADLVFCGYDKLHQLSGKYEHYKEFKAYPLSSRKSVVLRSYLLGRTHIAHWAAIYRKAFLKKNSLCYTEGWHVAGDTEFVCKVLLTSSKVSFIRKSLYIYRIRPNSITTKTPDETAFGSYYAYMRVLRSIKNPALRLFFLISKQARATNIILGKFYRAQIPMPYFYCSKYKILLYQILNCVVSRPQGAKMLLRYYVDTYLKKAQ